MTTAPTAADILRHTSAYHRCLLSRRDLRQRLLTSLLRPPASPHPDQTTSKTLLLAAQAVESSISSSAAASSSSSLRLTETTLLSLPRQTPTSSLLLSLIHAATHRPVDAAVCLLDVFALDPSAARSEISPVVFEDLFVYHLYPALQWFKEQRNRILSKKAPHLGRSRSSVGMGLISTMSGDEAAKLKELEAAYEEVVDENTRAFALFLKEVVQGRDGRDIGGDQVLPPSLVLGRIGDPSRTNQDKSLGVEEYGSIVDDSRQKQGRYNPLWVEEDEEESSSVGLGRPNDATVGRPPSPSPQRVPLSLLSNLPSPTTSSNPDFDKASFSAGGSFAEASSSESEGETEETNPKVTLVDFKHRQGALTESNSSPGATTLMADGGKQTPPKDFVCPITSHIFVDPVTLETGQTYERRAIQEWLERGNSTCPITRQKLQSSRLPKTNYVLKRLIAGWKDQNPGSKWSQTESPPPKPATNSNSTKPTSSPTSVITQASTDGTLGQLRLAISNLCTSDVLEESEKAVLRIEQFWKEASSVVPEIKALLSKPAVINGFVEILFNSIDPRILRATVFLLSELASRESIVIQTLTRVESDIECVVALFKKGLIEAVVLIYLLGPSHEQLLEMDMVEALLKVVKKQEEDTVGMCVTPRTAAVVLLGQIMRGIDEESVSKATRAVISEQAIESIVACLGSESVQERIAAVGVLLRCMEEEGSCRRGIAEKAEVTPVLESFVGANDGERFEIVAFLSELVKQNKRILNEQLLHNIKEGGSFSTMHTLLIYLQAALPDQRPVVAGLLLQLDLLTPPKKMSIYREEAIDALVSCLKNPEFPGTQITAAETIMALQGRFSSSGMPLARAYLLKRAGLEKNYRAIIRANRHNHATDNFKENLKEEEEKAAEEWEKRMAFALVGHEFGLLFEALSEGLNSKYGELSRACFESATWLVHMLSVLPNTGVRGAARVCLLKRFISIFNSARDPEDKALAMLALKSFIEDPEGLHEVTINVKGILRNLRELKKSSVVATEMLKDLSEGQDPSSIELWTHKELTQVDCCSNGEVFCVTCFKDMTFSGHFDGSIKVWTGKGNLHPRMDMREHTKAVTRLQVQQSGDKLYSGSLDRTVRVWTIGEETIKCIQLYDMKDQVQDMAVANTISCFIPQGSGVKVQSWNGSSKLLNPNKHVRCLALLQGKLYCGCSDNSIQEIDLVSGTLSSVQQGNRKLLGKAHPIYALQVHNGLLYSAGAPIDGAAVKIWSVSNFSLVGTLSSSSEIRSMAVTSELIYLGCKNGVVEIWSGEKHNRVGTVQAGTNTRVTCMAVNDDEDVLVIGTSDGRIQAWGLA